MASTRLRTLSGQEKATGKLRGFPRRRRLTRRTLMLVSRNSKVEIRRWEPKVKRSVDFRDLLHLRIAPAQRAAHARWRGWCLSPRQPFRVRTMYGMWRSFVADG